MKQVDFVLCQNEFRCWECSENCNIKTLFLLPEDVFMSILNNSRATNISLTMSLGLPIEESERILDTKVTSLIVARKQYLESQK